MGWGCPVRHTCAQGAGGVEGGEKALGGGIRRGQAAGGELAGERDESGEKAQAL